VGINYDRVIEDRTLLRKGDPDAPRRGLGARRRRRRRRAPHAWVIRRPAGMRDQLGLLLRSRWHRFRLCLRQLRHAGFGARMVSSAWSSR
jgi:hypothetical protein